MIIARFPHFPSFKGILGSSDLVEPAVQITCLIPGTGTGKIFDFFTSQRGVFTEEFEKAACRELLQKLKSKGLDGFSLVTDRHSGIKAMIRDMPDFKDIIHYFDIWHLAKEHQQEAGENDEVE